MKNGNAAFRDLSSSSDAPQRLSLSVVVRAVLLAGRVPLPLNRVICFLQTWREAARLIFPAERTATRGTD